MDLIKQIDQELPPDSKIRQLPGYQELMSHRTINSFLVITSPTLQECTLWWVRFIFLHREFWTRADARNPAGGGRYPTHRRCPGDSVPQTASRAHIHSRHDAHIEEHAAWLVGAGACLRPGGVG